ncbi:heme/hemin ABC transporter substrate-binding protein [Hyphomicrobium sp.]|uniref:heme/hemin ABC transporter substrate-binding protein n=1 Tax=Hyphomicrobium sp. TaxID=82 RepID=UPI002CA04732|nr:ABC transporter substrate-binding protein [Hyphomicrobium sp.]HVZ03818.1 ABC transporter substrate-binding protein [Hyphomicrobium sp.]
MLTKFSRVSALAAFLSLLLASLPVAADPNKADTSAPRPARIISAGGVITEIVYALGRADLLVGVDSTSQFPAAALKEKPNVGYVRALSSEGLLSLKPTSIIAIESAGPPDVLKAVEEAGVKITRVPEVATPAGISAKITEVASLIGEKEKGVALAAAIDKKFEALDGLRAKIEKPRRALFILSFQNGRAMVGGRTTSADGIITLAGMKNAASALEGWKPISDEALLEAAPDVIIAMDHGPQTVTVDSILAVPAFAATPAAKSKSVLIFDGGYLLGFGPRTPDAARDLLLAAYPDLARSDQHSSRQ